MFLGVPGEPLQVVVNRADFPSVVGGMERFYPVVLSGVYNDGSPQRGLRVVRAVRNTHHPTVPEEREAEPPVYRTTSGEGSVG